MDPPSRLGYIFGTDEYVQIRKRLTELREKFLNHANLEQSFHIICGGSLGEGITYPTSDDDLMFYSIKFQVVKTISEATRMYDVLLDTSECYPGYCLLYDVNTSYPEDMLFVINKRPFLSSTSWKVSSLRENEFIHGPCGSGVLDSTEYDFASGLFVSFWPEIASEWVSRKRYWPSVEIVLNIVTNGCHVVPIGNPDSLFYFHEWRISFCTGERKLMHSFNHAQFLVYNLLRLTLKRILDKEAQDVFCSYFLKNTLFYTIESSCTQSWCVNNLGPCYKSCISKLHEFVDNSNLPNYFMPEYNMIRRKINRENKRKILDVIRSIQMIGVVGVIHLCDESECLVDSLSSSFLEWKLDKEFMLSFLFRQTNLAIRNFFCKCSSVRSAKVSLCNALRLLASDLSVVNSDFVDILVSKAIIYCCERMMNVIQSEQHDNKQSYSMHKTITCLIQLAYKGDLTTGKLTEATFLYTTHKPKCALAIIRQLLLECPTYLMDNTFNDIERRQYVELICGRRHSINFKAKHAWATMYELFSDSLNAWPDSLRIFVSECAIVDLNPITYAYILESLCHVSLLDQISLNRSTRYLLNQIDFAVGDEMIAAIGRMSLGIIKFAHHDNQSACRWIGSAYLLSDSIMSPYDKKFSRAALTYIACMLNRHFD